MGVEPGPEWQVLAGVWGVSRAGLGLSPPSRLSAPLSPAPAQRFGTLEVPLLTPPAGQPGEPWPAWPLPGGPREAALDQGPELWEVWPSAPHAGVTLMASGWTPWGCTVSPASRGRCLPPVPGDTGLALQGLQRVGRWPSAAPWQLGFPPGTWAAAAGAAVALRTEQMLPPLSSPQEARGSFRSTQVGWGGGGGKQEAPPSLWPHLLDPGDHTRVQGWVDGRTTAWGPPPEPLPPLFPSPSNACS